MNESKHYIIVDTLHKNYAYNVNNSTFSSDICNATLRTYAESEKMLITIYFYRPSVVRKCVIKNIRKIKLEMLNRINE